MLQFSPWTKPTYYTLCIAKLQVQWLLSGGDYAHAPPGGCPTVQLM